MTKEETMVEISVITAVGVRCFQIRIGRTMVLLVLTVLSSTHFH
jgi:hypothetical protein